jgi:3-oxoacyl-[acyl-carrier protein] reductase
VAARDPFDFSGQVVWITGAARGIGLACARAFLERGARVVAFDVAAGEEASGLRASGFGLGDNDTQRSSSSSLSPRPKTPSSNPMASQVSLTLDVSDADAVTAAALELAAQGLAPHVLVNNAGITRDGMLWKLSLDDWRRVLDVNLDGAFHMLREAFPLMRQRGGAIVNVASINGERGKIGQANYTAAKAGLIGLTKTAAREGGRFGIRVNAVSPGMIETDMTAHVPEQSRRKALEETALGRLGTPQDVANAVLFLASPYAQHITGQTIRVDGGQCM